MVRNATSRPGPLSAAATGAAKHPAVTPRLSRRALLAAGAAALAAPNLARAEAVKPKVTVISQWSSGSDGAAITALGELLEHARTHLGRAQLRDALVDRQRRQLLVGRRRQERVHAAGGTLVVSERIPHGTVVEVALPCGS